MCNWNHATLKSLLEVKRETTADRYNLIVIKLNKHLAFTGDHNEIICKSLCEIAEPICLGGEVVALPIW